MNRLLAILVTLFILFLVYLWINHLVGSPGKENGDGEAPAVETTGEQQPDNPDEYHIPDDYVPNENESVEGEETEEATPQPVENVEEKTIETPPVEEKKPVQPEVKPVTKPAEPVVKKTEPAPPTTVKTSEKDAGTHLVIAGNFVARANAEERVKELKKIGYPKAEVVNFELSEYHTACAGRYSDINEARRVAKKIKDMHGIDTYVRHGN